MVAQFRSYLTPLIIMAPIPLTMIGIMPGHALLDAQFTATSMIGMIALAGIIVRNSILLVDFIELETARGMPFKEAGSSPPRCARNRSRSPPWRRCSGRSSSWTTRSSTAWPCP